MDKGKISIVNITLTRDVVELGSTVGTVLVTRLNGCRLVSDSQCFSERKREKKIIMM